LFLRVSVGGATVAIVEEGREGEKVERGGRKGGGGGGGGGRS